jgi:CHAT domain-containing protein
LAAELGRLGRERERVLAGLARDAPEAGYAVGGRPVVELDELRACLGAGRALVAYLVEGDRYGALVVTGAGVRAVRGMARVEEVEQALGRLRFALGTPRVDPRTGRAGAAVGAAVAALAQLHRQLVAPLGEALGDRALTVVPHARLHLVPFHALAAPGGPLLGERELTVAPSATALTRTLGRRVRGRGALVVARADERAPAIAAEARTVAGLLGGARVLAGADATGGRVRREAMGVRVLHVAAHGVYEPDEVLLSGLELADGRLTLAGVAALGLDAALVTLSACESGVGAATGDEVLGLTRAFLQAGARSLVASLWAVPDAATAQLMESFYRRLVAGQGVAAALGGAMVEVRREHPHPYHWAPFTVVGGWAGI